MKNLALLFCSLRPIQLNENICDYRETEYNIFLKQLFRIIPKSFDIIVCENTINNIDEIKNQELKKIFDDVNVCALGSENNIGTSNKGMGELLMLKSALDDVDLNQYTNISYVTARRFYTCPYVFERTENLKASALISNPDFVFLNGNFCETCKSGQYNDMFFSMKCDTMLNYANYSMDHMRNNNSSVVGSEQLLYNFINQFDVKYEWLDWLGIIRNDWERTGVASDINNYHIC